MPLGQCSPAGFVASLAGGYGKPLHLLYPMISTSNSQYLVERASLLAFIRSAIGHRIEDVDWVSRHTTIMHKPNGFLDHLCAPKRLSHPISAYYLSPARNAHPWRGAFPFGDNGLSCRLDSAPQLALSHHWLAAMESRLAYYIFRFLPVTYNIS